MKKGPFTKPPAIHVYVTVRPNATNGISEAFTSRIGTCSDEKEVAGIIASDLRAMGDTFGGFMEPVSTNGRSYRAFRAEWSEIKL